MNGHTDKKIRVVVANPVEITISTEVCARINSNYNNTDEFNYHNMYPDVVTRSQTTTPRNMMNHDNGNNSYSEVSISSSDPAYDNKEEDEGTAEEENAGIYNDNEYLIQEGMTNNSTIPTNQVSANGDAGGSSVGGGNRGTCSIERIILVYLLDLNIICIN